MIVDLTLAKKYLRLDEDNTYEDDLILLMIDNAEGFIKSSGVVLDSNDEALMKQAKLLALMLVSDFYENRSIDRIISDKARTAVKSILIPGGSVL